MPTISVQAGGYWRNLTLIPYDNELVKLTFGYNAALVAEVKELEGARWHPEEKFWTIKRTQRNVFVLTYLQGLNPYEPYECELVKYESKRPLHQYQLEDVRAVLTRRQMILAAEMGCIAGDTRISINKGGAVTKTTVKKFYNDWISGWQYANKLLPQLYANNINIRSFDGKLIKLNMVNGVFLQGFKKVIKIITESGKEIVLTPEHEIAIENGYKEAQNLQIGQKILTNGKWLDDDGYMRVGGYKNKHPRWTTGGVYEHILVMESIIGRYVKSTERVHHKNRIRHDNRPDNLELYETNSEHAREHGWCNYKNFGNGSLVPRLESIIDIQDAGYQFVYDIACNEPYHNFIANNIIVHNCGKSLVAIETMEASGFKGEECIWVGPKSALRSVELELLKWQSKIWPLLVTYDALKKLIANWPKNKPAPRIIILDEFQKVKNPQAQRSQAAKYICDSMRKEYERDCIILGMSGTPSPRNPSDWYWPCEIICPGFIRESNIFKFKNRLGLIQQKESLVGGIYPELITWYDDEKKCHKCGKLQDDMCHSAISMLEPSYHAFVPSKNEIKTLYERLKGLVIVQFKRDVLKELPDKIYRIIRCTPTPEVLRAAKLIVAKSSRTITANILLRELSDGFQYVDQEIGHRLCNQCLGKQSILHPCFVSYKCEQCGFESSNEVSNCEKCEKDLYSSEITYKNQEITCPTCSGTGETLIYQREAVQVSCPKEDIFIDMLEEHEDIGRLVTYAGFTASVDRCVSVALKQRWNVIRCDGRGFQYFDYNNNNPIISDIGMLQLFQDKKRDVEKACFIGQADSGGLGITLTASPSIFYYSNTFKYESKAQSMDRIHRIGMDKNKGATIIECFHLPSDELVYNNLMKKRDLQSLSLGEVQKAFEGV